MTGPTYQLHQYASYRSDLASDQLVIAGDAAIAIDPASIKSTYLLNKGSAAAITIIPPLTGEPKAGGHDGVRITVITLTAFAHVITQGTVGFNAKGASGTATFTAAKGNAVTLEAYNGNWYVVSTNGVTIA